MLESEEKSTRNELEMYRSYTLLEEQDGAGITQAPTNTSTRFTLIIYGKIGNVSMYLL